MAVTISGDATDSNSRAFDYQFGTWRVHVSRLLDPGMARPQWTDYDGTHTVTPLFSGQANIGVLEIGGSKGRIEGLQLRLYDPATAQWKLWFANGDNGVVQPASTGRFNGNTGTFFNSDRIAGRVAQVRTITTLLTPSRYRDVTEYSLDNGRTWRPLWIATYTKVATGVPAGTSSASRNDFDFQVGSWRVQLQRLAARLRGSHSWSTYDGSLVVRRLWNGRANVGELDVRNGADRIATIMLRTYDSQTGRWSDYATDMADGSVLFPPAVGRFDKQRGELYDREMFNGQPIVVRYVFDEITPQSCRFVQSFSNDYGKTWEANLVVHFTRDDARATGFDFSFGTWQTHISVLRQTTNGASAWVTMRGTVVTSKVWNGRANLEEIEANSPSGRFEGMTLRLYNPQAREWNLYWSESGDGAMGTPAVGTFHDGIGEFSDQEQLGGKMVFVRQRYYDITPVSYRFEQAVSYDGGIQWQPNFRASLTREPIASTTPEPVAASPAAQHAFDWQIGTWNVQMSRLKDPLSGSTAWTKLEARVVVRRVWAGRANLAEISANGPTGHLEFLSLRLFAPASGQWSLNFASVNNGEFGVPLYGTFKNGRADFYDQELYKGHTIWTRFSFYDVGTSSARDEQAFSPDRGRTWQVNWINVHSRASPSPT